MDYWKVKAKTFEWNKFKVWEIYINLNCLEFTVHVVDHPSPLKSANQISIHCWLAQRSGHFDMNIMTVYNITTDLIRYTYTQRNLVWCRHKNFVFKWMKNKKQELLRQ